MTSQQQSGQAPTHGQDDQQYLGGSDARAQMAEQYHRILRNRRIIRFFKVVTTVMVILLLGIIAAQFAGMKADVKSSADYIRAQKAAAKQEQKLAKNSPTKDYSMGAAESVAIKLTHSCMSYAQSLPSAQIDLLMRNCGWQGDGNGAPDFVNVDPNIVNQYQPTDNKGLWIITVQVHYPNQPDYLTYLVPVEASADGHASVAAPGAFFPSAPNFYISKSTCRSPDDQVDVTSITQTIKTLFAGLTRKPDVDPDRYVMPGKHIGLMPTSIKRMVPESVTVCGGNNKHRQITVQTQLDGPTSGAQFTQSYAFDLVRYNGEWRINLWGPDFTYQVGS